MRFDENSIVKNLGVKIGYLLAYFIFTTFLYLLFFLTNKLPQNNSNFIVIGITITLSTIGMIISKLLKYNG